MSKLVARFPHQPPYMEIYISNAGVELHYFGQTEADRQGVTLDPVRARTLATLLMHASNEAEMMRMRQAMEDERHEVDAIVQSVRKPGT